MTFNGELTSQTLSKNKNDVIFFVFSYNRGPHLWNCVQSIEHCAPGKKIIVFDDNSDDPETVSILKQIESKHEIFSTERDVNTSQHGALYVNMQRALDMTEDGKILMSFLQDDTQMVRPLTDSDIADLSNYFDHNPYAGFLSPVFRCAITRQKVHDRLRYQPEKNVYYYDRQSRKPIAGVYYSDISITRADRLKSVNWIFEMDEYSNEKQAERNFERMGYVFVPFAMWLPNGPAYRFKKKSLTFRLGEYLNASGLYPYEIMDQPTVDRLSERPTEEKAIAENYLSIRGNKQPRQPWIFSPTRRPKWLRKAEKWEKFFRTALKA